MGGAVQPGACRVSGHALAPTTLEPGLEPGTHEFGPQLFYYGGEQLSQQRAEQQLGTQLVALQVLGWDQGGAVGGVWLWAGLCAFAGRVWP